MKHNLIENLIELLREEIKVNICILKVLSLLVLKVSNDNENVVEVRDKELHIDEVLKASVKKYFDFEKELSMAEKNIYKRASERKKMLIESHKLISPDILMTGREKERR